MSLVIWCEHSTLVQGYLDNSRGPGEARHGSTHVQSQHSEGRKMSRPRPAWVHSQDAISKKEAEGARGALGTHFHCCSRGGVRGWGLSRV